MLDSISESISDPTSNPAPKPLPASPPGAPPPAQNPAPSTQNQVTEARAAHTKLSRTARLLSDALLARTEARLAEDPAALDTEQVAGGVKILQDLVSIEKTLLSHLLMIDHMETSATRNATPITSTPNPSTSNNTPSAPVSSNPVNPPPSLNPVNSESSFSLAPLSAVPPAKPDSSFAIRNSSFIPYRFQTPQLPGVLNILDPLGSIKNPPAPLARASTSLLSLRSIPSIPSCPLFTPQLLHHRLRQLESRIAAFPARKLSPAWQIPNTASNPLPDYSKPAPGYKPPPDYRWGLGKFQPTLRRDPDNPGRFRWVHPRPKPRDSS